MRNKIMNILGYIVVIALSSCSSTIKDSNDKLFSIDNIDTTTIYSSSTKPIGSNLFPKEVLQMNNLKSLTFQGCWTDVKTDTSCRCIKIIPKEIGELKKLESLRLPLNCISNLPTEVNKLNSLRILDLTDNVAFQDLSQLTKIIGLEELYLFGCSISKIPDNISNLKRLTKIALTGNPLPESEILKLKLALPNCEVIF